MKNINRLLPVISLSIVAFLAGFLTLACLNPIGFYAGPQIDQVVITQEIEINNQIGEGSTTDPTVVLPEDIRDDFGILIVKNITKTQNLVKVTFERNDKHFEMVPGPYAGDARAIILGKSLAPEDWVITAYYQNKDGTGDVKTVSIGKTVVAAGLLNRVNYVYFFKEYKSDGTGDYELSNNDGGPENEVPPRQVDENDYLDNTTGGGGDGGGSEPTEGEVSNEDTPIIINDPYRQSYGIVTVKNLTRSKPITKVE
jgi:hypothetical protein